MPTASELPERLSLDDPRALRALAHEVRQHVIALLYSGEQLTATQAADRCGVSPSAMSYHLRTLERWGVVTRAEPSDDGRERPWRAVARGLDLQAAADQAPGAVAPLLVSFAREAERALRAFSARPRDEKRAGTVRRGVTRLTPDQARAMNAEVQAVLERYDDLAAPDDAEARHWDVFYIAVPGEPTSPSG